MKNFYFIPVLMILLLVSCAKSIQTVDDNVPKSWTENWIVASKTVVAECEFTNGKRFWIKRNGDSVWELTTPYVKGFEYTEGYEYDIDVKATEIPEPPMDSPSIYYSLIRINSKVQKVSDVPTL